MLNKFDAGHPKQPTQPLLRLRVEYQSQEQLFNTVRFGLQFQGQVANPNDLLLMKKSAKLRGGEKKEAMIDEEAFQNAAVSEKYKLSQCSTV